MFKFLKSLFGTEAEKSSEPHGTNEKQETASVSIRPMAENAFVSLYEKENGRAATEEEKAAIMGTVRQIETQPYEPDGYGSDPELMEIQRQDAIEELANRIRQVVVVFVELLQEPFPYKVKKGIPEIKENHRFVLEQFDKDIYGDAVAFAREDMFEGWAKLLENVDECRAFFEEYTGHPHALSLNQIREAMPEKYRNDVDAGLFEL